MINITDVRAFPGDSAYLIESDSGAVLYDSGFAYSAEGIIGNIKKQLGDKPLCAVILTHSHYDHVLASPYILKEYPDAKVYGGEYCKRIFEKPSARAVMRDLDKKAAKKEGIYEYPDLIDELRIDFPLCDGDIFTVCGITFKAIHLPGHTKCSFGYYIESEKLLLSSETLGVFDGEEIIVPSYLVGYKMTLDSIDKALSLDIDKILIPHFGPIDSEKTAFYLYNAKKTATETFKDIAKILKDPKDEKKAFDYFKEKFYKGAVIPAYPYDAFELNTNIMIALIKKEMGKV